MARTEDRLVRVAAHRSLAFKLFGFVAALLFTTLAANGWQQGQTLRSLLLLQIQERTMQDARLAANNVTTVLESWAAQMVATTSALSGLPRADYATLVTSFARSHRDFMTFTLLERDAAGHTKRLATASTIDPTDERLQGAAAADVRAQLDSLTTSWLDAAGPAERDGEVKLRNLSEALSLPVLAIAQAFPVKDSSSRVVAVLTIWQTSLYAALAAGSSGTAVVLDDDGAVVTASSVKTLGSRRNFAAHPVFKEASRLAVQLGFKNWKTRSGARMLGAFARIPRFGLVVLTNASAKPADQAIAQTLLRTALWGVLFLLVAVLASYLATQGITRSLRALMRSTINIAGGDFKAKVPVRTADEVGLLGTAVNHMAGQLEVLMSERLEKARLESELKTAKYVQETFVPQSGVTDGDLLVSSFFQPATECGGDWWGHYRLSETHHMICIADATGHGVPAALVTAMVYAAASLMSRQISEGRFRASPKALLEEFNKTMCGHNPGVHTMTFFICLVDTATGALHYANAGHTHPILLRGAGRRDKTESRKEMLRTQGNPLGMSLDVTFHEATLQLTPGDRVVMYTDGLIECTNAAGEQWSKRRLFRVVDDGRTLELGPFSESLVSTAYKHFAGHPADDDVTIVVWEMSTAWTPRALATNEPAA